MIIYKCDMCGKQLPDCDVYAVTIRHLTDTFRYADNFPVRRLDYEVCPECRDKIIEYIENGGEKNERLQAIHEIRL